MSSADAFADAPVSLAPHAASVIPASAPRVVAIAGVLATGGALAAQALPLSFVVAGVTASLAAVLVALRGGRAGAEPLLLAGVAVIAAALATVGEPAVALAVHASAVALGAVVPGRRLAWVLPVVAVALAAAVEASEPLQPGLAVVHALFVLGFGALGRGLFFATLFFVRRREQARADEEILRVLDDARLYRVVGSGDDGGSPDERKQLIAHTLAARDACYRVLTLGGEGLRADGAAVYLLDENSAHLVLREQHVQGEQQLAGRLPVKSGIAGLCVSKKMAIRLVDEQSAVLRAHNASARSAVAVPLVERGSAFGALVFDRTDAQAFTEGEERLALLLARELQSALLTERVLVSLDDERRRVQRVLEAARAFSGVVRLDDALDQILAVSAELAPRAGVCVLTVERDAATPPLLCVARARGETGLVEGARHTVDPETWTGRALLQKAALPHTSLAQAPAHGLIAADDEGTRDFGDLLVLPLVAQGEAGGLLVITAPAGTRLSTELKTGLRALADMAGLALSGAKLFFVVEQRATTDGLTGLYNRRTLDEKLAEAILRARRSRQPLALLLTDVDHFKRVNDTYGHGTGDDVLRGVSAALKATARTSDIVARYGGEEFVLVLEGTDAEGAVRLAERARLGVKALTFTSDKGPLSVTSSFGVALFQDGDDAHHLLERADANLYRAKERGRDRVVA